MSVTQLADLLDDSTIDAPFDGWGRRLIVPEGGGKAVPHTRVTTFIKAVSDTGGTGIRDWHARHAAKGIVDDPELMQWIMDHDADPDDKPVKGEFNRRLETAAKRAGRDDKADQGTAIHDAISRTIAGRNVVSHPEIDGPLREFKRLCEAHNIKFVASEKVIVHDIYKVSGRFDIIGTVGDGPLVVLDAKTGSVDYPSDYPLQLWLYATASSIYDAASETHHPMPEGIDATHGYIIHVPRDGSTGGLYRVDLSSAEEMCEIALKKRGWPKIAKKQFVLVKESEQFAVATEVEPVGDRTEWLLDRITAILGTVGKDRVRREWDSFIGAEIPTPALVANGNAVWSEEQIDRIADYCDKIEGTFQMDFGASDPVVLERPEPAPEPAPHVRPSAPVDDSPGDADMVGVLRRDIEADPAVKTLLGRWAVESSRSNVFFLPDTEAPLKRQCEITRAALRCAEHLYDYSDDSEDIVRAAIHTVTGDETCQFPTYPVGALLGTLTTEQACQLATIAQFSELRISESGQPRFVFTQMETHT